MSVFKLFNVFSFRLKTIIIFHVLFRFDLFFRSFYSSQMGRKKQNRGCEEGLTFNLTQKGESVSKIREPLLYV